MADDEIKVGSDAWAKKVYAVLEKDDGQADPEKVARAHKMLEEHGFGVPVEEEAVGFTGDLPKDLGGKTTSGAKQPPRRRMGSAEAAKLGLAQGATVNMGEEVEAAVASLASEGEPLPEELELLKRRLPVHRDARTTGRTIDAAIDPRTPYQAIVDDLRDTLGVAMEDRPMEFFGSEMIGSGAPGVVATGFTPVGHGTRLFGKAAQESRKLTAARSAAAAEKGFKARMKDALEDTLPAGAALGALTGMGVSDFREGAASVVGDIAMQTAFGGAGAAGGALAGDILSAPSRGAGRAAHKSLLKQETRGGDAVSYARAMEAGASPQFLGAPGGVNYGDDMMAVIDRAQEKGITGAVELARQDTGVHLLPAMKKRMDAAINGTKVAKSNYYESVGGGAPINMQPVADEIQILMQEADNGVFSAEVNRKLKPLYDSMFEKPMPGELIGTAAEQATSPRGKVTGLELSPSAVASGSKKTPAARPRREIIPGIVKELDIKSFDESLDLLKNMIKDSKYERGLQEKLTHVRDSMRLLRAKTHGRHSENMKYWGTQLEESQDSVRALGMNPDKKMGDFAKGERSDEMVALRNSINEYSLPGNSDSRASMELDALAAKDPQLKKLLNTNRGLLAMDRIKEGPGGSPMRVVASPKGGVSGYGALSLTEAVKYRTAGLKSASLAHEGSKLGATLAASIDQDMAAAVTDEKMEAFYRWVIEAQSEARDLIPDELLER